MSQQKSESVLLKGEPVTMHGLNHWFDHVFEKFGWMILALKHGNVDKVNVYLHSLEHLITDINLKLKSTQDADRKADLVIMRDHVATLINVANRVFNTSDLVGGAKKKSSKKTSKKSKKY